MAQPGSPEPTKRSRRRKHGEFATSLAADLTASHVTKKLRATNDELCLDCNKIDFAKLFSTRMTLPTHPLEQAIESVNCTFCSLIAKTVREAYPDLGALQYRFETSNAPLHYRILSCPTRFEDLLQRQGVSPSIHIEIQLGRETLVSGSDNKRVGWIYVPDSRRSRLSFDLIRDADASENTAGGLEMIRRPIGASVDPLMLQRWLNTCAEEHSHAGHAQHYNEGAFAELLQCGYFRLIDVDLCAIVEVDTVPRYLALSYIWGNVMLEVAREISLIMSRTTCNSSRSIDLSTITRMPRTVLDAMDVVKMLRERYLWVDSVCINQGYNHEKQHVISSMSEIYHRSIATIVAASGLDASAGLPRLGEKRSTSEQLIRLNSGFETAVLLPRRPNLESLLEDTIWGTRAWTYQERLLSPRCIFFTEHEAFFTCSSRVFREAYTLRAKPFRDGQIEEVSMQHSKPLTLQDRFADMRPPAEADWLGAAWSMYHIAVGEFSRRALSHPGDRMNAFQGVCARLNLLFADLQFDSLLRALPRKKFSQMIQWGFGQASERSDLSLNHRVLRNTIGDMYLPSWSWVGWIGPVSSAVAMNDYPDYQLQIDQLDRTNILARPVLSKQSFEPWPFEPTLCVPACPYDVVLHLWVPIIACELISTVADPAAGNLKNAKHNIVVKAPTQGERQGIKTKRCLGHIYTSKSWAEQRAYNMIYKLILLPSFSDNGLAPSILIEQSDIGADTFAERVPMILYLHHGGGDGHDINDDSELRHISHPRVEGDVITIDWMQYASYEHIKFR